MKKILMCLLCTLAFIINPKNSEALSDEAYIYLGPEIPDIRLYLKTPTVEKYKKMYQIINRNTNELVYCIEPGVILKDGYFTAYQSVDFIDIDFTDEQWNYVRQIAFYGYGYEGRTDIRWYAAAQYLIWEYLLEGKGVIYFVDNSNNKIDILKEEIETIKKDVAAHMILPSFLENAKNIEVDIGETLTFTDTNHVLDKFEIYGGNIDWRINGDNLIVHFNNPGYDELFFRNVHFNPNMPKIYYSPDNQTVINRSKVIYPSGSLKFTVDFPSFKLTKKSVDQSSLSLAKAKYGIYYLDGVGYAELLTDKEGNAYLDEIHPGKYYLQEIEAPYGYELNPEKIYFEVIDKDITIEVKDNLIKKDIIIEKYREEINGELELEKNAKFEVIDAFTNKIITNFTTNEYGKYNLKLPYGQYIIKQLTSTLGYNLADDIIITINEKTVNNLTIVIKNTKVKGSIIIEKKDSVNGEIIEDYAEFKIYNIKTKEYLKVDGQEIFKTKQGQLIIENIPYGQYELIEINPPEGYQVTNEKIYFNITKDKEQIKLEVLNSKKKGILIIEKKDDETLKPLANVLFGLYDQDKNLINKYYTDEFGKITINNLLEGLYYIKELETLNEYNLLEGFTEIQIKNGITSNLTVTNRIKIEVPKTSTNELFLTILIASLCLLIGSIICNHE